MTTNTNRPSRMVTGDTPAKPIGLAQGTALYISAILGAGVLVLPGQVASMAGPASLIAWSFSALLGLPLAFTFAALASRFPDAGGVATFAARAFGPFAGGIGGWWFFVAGSVGQTIVPLTAGYYVAVGTGVDQRWAPAIGAAVLGAAVLANLAGLRVSARVQVGLALGVALILAGVVATGLPNVGAGHFVPMAPQGIAGLGQAVIVLFFAFAGWEAVAHLSAEFRNVGRDLPLATLLTILVVTVLYLGVAFVVIGTGAYGSPHLDRISLGVVIERGLGLPAVAVVTVAAVVICLGTTNAFVAAVSRLGYALGRDGWAPSWLSRQDSRGGPRNAVLVVGAIGAAGLLGASTFGWGTEDIVSIPAVLVLATYLLSAAAAVRLFHGSRRLVAVAAFVPLLATAPFAGRNLAIPAVIACLIMIISRQRRRTASRRSDTTR